MIGFLVLKAVDERLSKEAKLVIDPVAEAGVIERRQRVKKARRETSQAAVAERGVGLEGLELFEVHPQLRHDRFRIVIEAQVREIVSERPAHEEFHREVVQPFGVLLDVAALAIAHRIKRRTADSH